MKVGAKMTALMAIMSFSLYAATITVPKDSSVSAAFQKSAANDTIIMAADTFIANFAIDHAITLVGAGKDSTIIISGERDSLATLRIVTKHVSIKDLTVLGHNGFRLADSVDSIHDWATSDAILLSGAESVSISSCNLIGGNGTDKRSFAAANGGAGLRIQKSSKSIVLFKDSIQGGMNDRTKSFGFDTIPGDTGPVLRPHWELGTPGAGLKVDSSSFIKADSIVICGGDGGGFNALGMTPEGVIGLQCVTAESISISNSFIRGGIRTYMMRPDTQVAYDLRLGTNLKMVNCIISEKGGQVDATSSDGTVGILSSPIFANKDNRIAVQYRDKTAQSLSVSCFLRKASFISIDILNASGRMIKQIKTEHAVPGVHQYTVDLKNMRGSSLSNAVYFIRAATNEHRQCFKIPITR